jgi:hypothetical protein
VEKMVTVVEGDAHDEVANAASRLPGVAREPSPPGVPRLPDLSQHDVVPARFHSARGLHLGGFVIHSNLSNVGHLLAAVQQ